MFQLSCVTLICVGLKETDTDHDMICCCCCCCCFRYPWLRLTLLEAVYLIAATLNHFRYQALTRGDLLVFEIRQIANFLEKQTLKFFPEEFRVPQHPRINCGG